MEKPVPYPSRSGFTLIELSIVLVIVGLIVGGVLVGQDLIRAAEVRSTVGQIEKYSSAMNTFRTKFNATPGDLSSNSAAMFGMTARSGATGHGDGNGLLEGCSAGAAVFGCEDALIWVDLSFANLVDAQFTSATDALTAVAAGSQASYFPTAKLGRGNYITVFSKGGLNYYEIAGITSTAATGIYTLTNALTPNEAFNMDNKIDDGAPQAGIVQAVDNMNSGTATALNTMAKVGAAFCVIGPPHQYNETTAVLAATPLCELRFHFN